MSFIRHLGHRPGLDRRTSECIEQVQTVVASAACSPEAATTCSL
jgi:hypothetical protein